MSNNIFEYATQLKLKGDSSRFIHIPASIILDKNLNTKRISVFAFMSYRRGIDRKFSFSINSLAEECGYKPNRHIGAINDQMSEIVTYFCEKGYITPSGKLSATKMTTCQWHSDKVSEECNKFVFATVYLDEMSKVLLFKSENPQNTSLTSSIILLVFAYLRMKIIRRPNKFRSDEKHMSITERRKVFPDAYNCYYDDIANDLGISERLVSAAVSVLKQLELIYYESLPRFQISDKRWRTNHTIFCNTYKRENGYELASGEEYYTTEAANKKSKFYRTKNKKKYNTEEKTT